MGTQFSYGHRVISTNNPQLYEYFDYIIQVTKYPSNNLSIHQILKIKREELVEIEIYNSLHDEIRIEKFVPYQYTLQLRYENYSLSLQNTFKILKVINQQFVNLEGHYIIALKECKYENISEFKYCLKQSKTITTIVTDPYGKNLKKIILNQKTLGIEIGEGRFNQLQIIKNDNQQYSVLESQRETIISCNNNSNFSKLSEGSEFKRKVFKGFQKFNKIQMDQLQQGDLINKLRTNKIEDSLGLQEIIQEIYQEENNQIYNREDLREEYQIQEKDLFNTNKELQNYNKQFIFF